MFPRFKPQKVSIQATKIAYRNWFKKDSFVYNDADSECTSCEYRKEHRDLKGNIYLG